METAPAAFAVVLTLIPTSPVPSRVFRLLAGCLLLAGALVVVPDATAFHAVPAGFSVHDAISRDAAESLGFPTAAVFALKQMTRRPDFDDGKASLALNGTLVLEITEMYRASHHCDRIPPKTDARAFREATAYVDEQRRLALSLLRNDEPQDAAMAIGRGLHALQDCFAHTNAVELGPEALQAYERTVILNGSAPPGLRLTGFDPNASYNMAPPGDDYPYSKFNLDSPNATPKCQEILPNGNSKFEEARQGALVASRLYLQSILSNLTPPQQEALRGIHEALPPGRIPFPSPGWASLVGSVALTAFAARRRRTTE